MRTTCRNGHAVHEMEALGHVLSPTTWDILREISRAENTHSPEIESLTASRTSHVYSLSLLPSQLQLASLHLQQAGRVRAKHRVLQTPTGRPRPTSFAHSEQVEKPWRHDATCAGPSQYRQRCNMKRLQTSAPLKPLKGRE